MMGKKQQQLSMCVCVLLQFCPSPSGLHAGPPRHRRTQNPAPDAVSTELHCGGDVKSGIEKS